MRREPTELPRRRPPALWRHILAVPHFHRPPFTVIVRPASQFTKRQRHNKTYLYKMFKVCLNLTVLRRYTTELSRLSFLVFSTIITQYPKARTLFDNGQIGRNRPSISIKRFFFRKFEIIAQRLARNVLVYGRYVIIFY